MEAVSGERMRRPVTRLPRHPSADDGGRRRAAPAPDGAEALRRVFRALKRRRRLIVGMMFAGAALAAAFGLITPRTYQATAQLLLDLRGADAADPRGANAAVSQGAEEAAIETHVTVLLSDANLRRTLAQLRAAGGSADAILEQSHSASLSGRLRDGMQEAWHAATRLLQGGGAAHQGELSADEAKENAALTRLRKGLKVGQERRSRVIGVSYTATDPDQAATIANAVAEGYVGSLTQQRRHNAEQALAWLSQRAEEMQRSLTRAEDAVQSYRLTHGLVEGAGANETEQQIAQAARQLALARSDAAAAQTRLVRAQTLRRQAAPAAALADALNAPALAELAQRQAALAADAPEAQRTALQAAIDHETGAAFAQLEAQNGALQGQIRSIEDRLQRLKDAAAESEGTLAGLRTLERQARAMAQGYDTLLQRRQQVSEQMQFSQPDIRLLASAWPPERPTSLHPVFLIPPITVAFGLLGALLAVGLDRLDRSLRSESEAAEALGAPCAASVPETAPAPLARLQNPRRDYPDPAYARAIRSILTSMLSTPAVLGTPKTILVTSSVAGEGKTSLAWALALAATHVRQRVLLLDLGPWPAPCPPAVPASRRSTAPGIRLRDVLAHRRPLADVAGRIPGTGIDYLPAASAEDDLLHLFGGTQMAALFAEMRDAYDLVIIDGPAISEGPEARLLAGWADEVLLAARWGKTARDVVRNAIDILESADGLNEAGAMQITTVLTRAGTRGSLELRAKPARPRARPAWLHPLKAAARRLRPIAPEPPRGKETKPATSSAEPGRFAQKG